MVITANIKQVPVIAFHTNLDIMTWNLEIHHFILNLQKWENDCRYVYINIQLKTCLTHNSRRLTEKNVAWKALYIVDTSIILSWLKFHILEVKYCLKLEKYVSYIVIRLFWKKHLKNALKSPYMYMTNWQVIYDQ